MALSNLRCTGRHKLCQSQNVLAPVNAMKSFCLFGVKKCGLTTFSEVPSLFQIKGISLDICHKAPVNWDRWAAPGEQVVYPQDKPIWLGEIEHSERSPDYCPRVFFILRWRECCQNFVQHSMLGLFRIIFNFLKCSNSIFGFSWSAHSEALSSPKCATHFAWTCRRVFSRISIFPNDSEPLKGATNLNFSTHPQWRCPTSVAPDAKSCGTLRTFWLLWLLSADFECPEWKKWVWTHFRKFGRFFQSLENVGRTEQGAGELGPLGCTSIMVQPIIIEKS